MLGYSRLSLLEKQKIKFEVVGSHIVSCGTKPGAATVMAHSIF